MNLLINKSKILIFKLFNTYIVNAIRIGKRNKNFFIFEILRRVDSVRIDDVRHPNHAFLDKVKNKAILLNITKNKVIILEDLLPDLFNRDARRNGQIIFSQDPV